MKLRYTLAVAAALASGGIGGAFAQIPPPPIPLQQMAPGPYAGQPMGGWMDYSGRAPNNDGYWRMHREHWRWGDPAAATPADRTAFMEAHLATLRAGLQLNAEQEKLWAAFEAGMRDMARQHQEMREQMMAAPRPADMFEMMRRKANMQIARGEQMKKFLEAANPLYVSLTPEQRARLPLLMKSGYFHHAVSCMGPGMGPSMGPGMDGPCRVGAGHGAGHGVMEHGVMGRSSMAPLKPQAAPPEEDDMD